MFSSYCVYVCTFLIGVFSIRKYSNLSLGNKRNKFKECFFLMIAIIFPSIVAGVRYDVGIDWDNYKLIYEYLTVGGTSTLEPGYILVLKIVKFFFRADYYFFNFVLSATLLSFVILAMLRIRTIEKTQMPIEMGYYIALVVTWGTSFNITRQCLASVIVLYAITFLFEKKWKYVFWVLVASLFHLSAVFCLLFVFLTIKQRNKLYQKIYTVTIYFLIVLMCFMLQDVLEIFSRLGLYSGYFDSNTSKFSIGFMLYIIFPLGLVVLYAPKSLKDNLYYDLFLKLFVLQIPIQFAGNLVNYADRMAVYCNISSIILFPLVASKIKRKTIKRQFIMLSYVWFVIYFIVMWGILKMNGVFPYQTKWG